MISSIAFVGLTLLSVLAGRNDDIISMATGIQGIREIVDRVDCQLEIEISPTQLLELRSMLSNPELKSKVSAATSKISSFAEDFPSRALDPVSARFADSVYKKEIERILTPVQIDATTNLSSPSTSISI